MVDELYYMNIGKISNGSIHAIKSEEQAYRCHGYQPISTRLLDIVRLLGCLRILPLHDVAFDDDNDVMSKMFTHLNML